LYLRGLGEKLLWCLLYLRGLGEKLLFLVLRGRDSDLSVHTSGKSCIVRGSCISGGVFELSHALYWLR